MNIILCVAIIVSYNYLNLILIRRSHYDNLFVVGDRRTKRGENGCVEKKIEENSQRAERRGK